MGFCWFTLRALRSWKSFKTDSLVDESRALVVKLQALLFKRRQHGLEVAPAPSRGLYWREGEESGTHVVVKECMSVFLLQLSVATSERAMKVGLRSTVSVCLSVYAREREQNRTDKMWRLYTVTFMRYFALPLRVTTHYHCFNGILLPKQGNSIHK